MMESDSSPRKNLWKNIKTQRTKLSGIDQTANSPVVSNVKQSNCNSQPSSLALQKKQSIQSNKKKQSYVKIISKFEQEDLKEQTNQNQLYDHIQDYRNYVNFVNSVPITTTQPQKYSRARKFSVGQQSIVEQIVDFKNPNNLYIGQFQQDQQPMIMSLGSQSNHASKKLKLSNIKEDLQKLQVIRQDISKQIQDFKNSSSQFIENTFNNLIAYVLQFYYQKMEANKLKLQQQKKNQVFKSRTFSKDLDTPKFSKNYEEYQQLWKKKVSINQQQINKLQEQIFKIKLQNQKLQSAVNQLNKQKQELSQTLFDYQQKIAQFQLEVNKKVQALVEVQLKDQQKIIDQARNNRKYYFEQIQILQKQIQKLSQKQNDEILDQIQQQQQILQYKQKQINQRQSALNQLEVQLNSQQFNIQRKLKAAQSKQIQLKKLQAVLEQKQIQLQIKQKQIQGRSIKKDSQIFQNHRYNHKATGSGDQNQSNLSLKLRELTGIRGAVNLKQKYHQPQEQKSQNLSFALTEGNHSRSWKSPKFGENILSKRKTDHESNFIGKLNGQKSKQKSIYNRSYITSNNKTQISPTSAFNTSHSSAHRNTNTKQDKGRLENLGAKLENLRNQIRKQIRDTE